VIKGSLELCWWWHSYCYSLPFWTG